MRPRLDKDVVKMLEQNACENARSVTQELNHAVRKFYTIQDNARTMAKIVKAQRKGGK